jgi:crotonobetainyl-CoA:carnitine CoA-transferase CaiB-like acyl-CoA transferase
VPWRTGRGQYVDLSQSEASLHFLGPALLDHEVNARLPHRVGNADPELAPHGVYPTAGRDCWVAIAVDGDAAFATLCDVMERPGLASDVRFATADGAGRSRRLDADRRGCAVARDGDRAGAQARGIPASASGHVSCAPTRSCHRGHAAGAADLGPRRSRGS